MTSPKPIPDVIATLTDEQQRWDDLLIGALVELQAALIAREEALAEALIQLAAVRRYHGRAINVLQGAGRTLG